jgi:glycosyltransferase involved in cell wall biosynthesis
VKARGRVAIQQRVLPAYRVAFFDALAGRCPDGLSIAAGEPRPTESILPASDLTVARWDRMQNIHIFGGLFYLVRQPGLIAWLERWDPGVLILEANLRYLTNWRAAAWMRARRRPVLGWGLGAPGRGPWARLMRRAWARGLDGAIAYSRRGADEYAAAGVRRDRLWVAPNAVVTVAEAAPRRAERAGEAPRLVFVGRLQARKRLDVLLEACAHLRRSPEVWIVGDGPARGDLERQAASLHLPVRFHGAVQGRDLEALLDAADLFVLPGTGGLAVQQAMARGLPVVVAEGDGTQEDLVTADNGWLVPPGDEPALRSTLEGALSDSTRLRGMGEASHLMAYERFNLGTMVDVFVQAISAVSPAA